MTSTSDFLVLLGRGVYIGTLGMERETGTGYPSGRSEYNVGNGYQKVVQITA